MYRNRAALAALAVAPVCLLVACGQDNNAQGSPASTTSAPITTSAPPTLPPSKTTEPSPRTTEVGIVEVFEKFEYYGACGNETVEVGGILYFPVLPDRQGEIDEGSYPRPADGMRQGVMRVAPPGPGDDVGTMTVYTDGFARFESESGWVIWLTDEEQTYNWVC